MLKITLGVSWWELDGNLMGTHRKQQKLPHLTQKKKIGTFECMMVHPNGYQKLLCN
jgi:hypothetical protein